MMRDEDDVGLDLPVEPLDTEEERRLRELRRRDGAAAAEVDAGPEFEPNAETGISRVDAPGQ